MVQGRDGKRLRKRYRGRHEPARAGTRATIPPMSTPPRRRPSRSSRSPSRRSWSSSAAGRARRRPARRRRVAPRPPSPPLAERGPARPRPARPASVDANAIYDAVEQQVIAIRGLKPSKPVARQFIDERRAPDAPHPAVRRGHAAGLSRRQRAAVQGARADPGGREPARPQPRPAQRRRGGLLPRRRGQALRRLEVGRHRARTSASTSRHEYDHALQDQNSTIFKDQHGVLDQSDRLLARQAVYEGDASLLMTQWAAANLTPGRPARDPRRRQRPGGAGGACRTRRRSCATR